MKTPFPKRFPWATLGRRETSFEFFSKWETQKNCAELFSQKPLISIVIPVHDSVSEKSLNLTMESLKWQSYPNWEAIVVFSSVAIKEGVSRIDDDRFKWIEAGDKGEVQSKNLGFKTTKGEWVGTVDAGAILSPVALYQFMLEMRSSRSSLFLYCNEVVLNKKFKKIRGYLSKPEYSWFNLAHFNYVGKFWLMRHYFWEKLGGFDVSCGKDHEHEFLLRLSEKMEKWHLVPHFLYYRGEQKEEERFGQDFLKCLKAHLQRRRFQADVTKLNFGNRSFLKILPKVENPEKKLISIVICFRDRSDWTSRCLKHLSRQVGEIPIEVILVNNQSKPDETKKIEQSLSEWPFPIRMVNYDAKFNFAHMHNLVVREYCQGEYLFLLNNDVFLSERTNLDELVSWVAQSWVGTVGILLRRPDGRVQHEGIRAGFGGEARLAKIGHFPTDDRFTRESREVFANTFAAVMVRREVFGARGGLGELDLVNGYGDVAFNFECLRQGLSNIYLGHIEGEHLESASRGMDYEYWEEFAIERTYPDILQKMLRQDLGWNRVPGSRPPLTAEMGGLITGQLRERATWLDPLKPALRKLFGGFKSWGEAR